MRHLVYEAEPVPRLFLWGEDPFPHPSVERLASLGRRASARVVTDRLAVERVRGTAIELLDAAPALAALDVADLDRLPASVAAWNLAAKLVLELIARERIVPQITPPRIRASREHGDSRLLGPGAARTAGALPPAVRDRH